jgi:hypothetical protein
MADLSDGYRQLHSNPHQVKEDWEPETRQARGHGSGFTHNSADIHRQPTREFQPLSVGEVQT